MYGLRRVGLKNPVSSKKQRPSNFASLGVTASLQQNASLHQFEEQPVEKLFPELQQLPSKSVCVCLLLICVVTPMTMKNIFIFLVSTDKHNTKA